MTRLALVLLASPLLAACARHARPAEAPRPFALVLGVAQDGGRPQVGCPRPCCESARADPSRRARVASLGLLDPAAGRAFLIDATPDAAVQIDALARAASRAAGSLPDGVLLTHAHAGHYTGLIHFGREAAGARGVPGWCTPAMAAFLRANGPWSLLVGAGHLALREVPPGTVVVLSPNLRARAVPVPHRREFSDTVAWRIEGPGRTLLYLPDLDAWDAVEGGLARLVDGVDVALVDGTFFDPAVEVRARDPREIPHPPIPDTLARFAALPRRPTLLFTHLNHTNGALDPGSRESRRIVEAGARVAREGERIGL